MLKSTLILIQLLLAVAAIAVGVAAWKSSRKSEYVFCYFFHTTKDEMGLP